VISLRVLIAASLLVLVAACGGDENPVVKPTPTPDERIEYWAEVLAQRQLEHNGAFVCAVIDQPTGSFGGGDDASLIGQIPSEIGEAVSIRMLEKLHEKCADEDPTAPPDCGWTCYFEPSPSN
jgi:hypothetical protein